MAIGIGLGHRRRADHAAGAWPALDDDRVAELERKLLRHGARDDVDGAASGVRHDGADRSRGPALGAGTVRGHQHQRKRAEPDHLILPEYFEPCYESCSA